MMREFFLALGFFTRIPVPSHPNYSDEAMRRSAIYYPLVGIVVGAVMALVYYLANMLFSVPLSVLLALCTGFLVTGGFHEDGWADTFDGLGGAFQRDKKLEIMTDSRLGTYGSLALWAILTLKTFCLIELLPQTGIISLIVVHGLSRWSSMTAMVYGTYVRVGQSKSKPVVSHMSAWRWLVAGLFVVPTLYFVPLAVAIALVVGSVVVAFVWLALLKQQIGGYTGDTLGACQQLAEVCLYFIWLGFLAQ